MSGNNFPHTDISEDVRELMVSISECRHADCLIPQRHPFYPVPESPPFYYGKQPCMPVVPTYLTSGRVMILGHYPNCRFGTVEIDGSNPKEFVPVADINEPFEAGRYFDQYGVRDYPTAISLHNFYLKPLGLSLRDDVWLTNMIKCFMMKEEQVETYETTSWDKPPTAATFDDKFTIANTCMAQHLVQEIEQCQPLLIIAFGAGNLRTILGKPTDFIDYSEVNGTSLRASETAAPWDTRIPLFADQNVILLTHPTALAIDSSREGKRIKRHLDEDIPPTLEFLGDLYAEGQHEERALAAYRRVLSMYEELEQSATNPSDPTASERVRAKIAKIEQNGAERNE